ncbi:hypothetical protein ASPSYDRAFT_91367 [Aspergillus sydowii CBS 593.65]|nr:uncharacterized protein ASPSYDRAFT_91367 [Aspergillus sydowii CBS 593.65]OJJ57075.1 hypothetical protein ASPSYDRAFT_91367 [Aspergillus sydowii CBS 593.65]
MACIPIGKVTVKIYPRTISNFSDFIENDLLPALHENRYKPQKGDTYMLATNVHKNEPTYVSQIEDTKRPADDLLREFFQYKENGTIAPIHVIIE